MAKWFATRAVTNQVVDSYIGVTGTDRIAQWSRKVKSSHSRDDSTAKAVWKTITQNETHKNIPVQPSLYTGIYNDSWFGKVRIKVTGSQLRFQSERSPQLKGNMYSYAKDTFVVRWDNPQINVDAFVNFAMSREGKATGFTMQRVLSNTSFGYDFQELTFIRLAK